MSVEKRIVLLPGDGIGPEVSRVAVQMLELIQDVKDLRFRIEEASLGGCAIERYGEPFPAATRLAVEENDAVLLAAIGGPTWEDLPQEKKPERGLLELRKTLQVFANLRPARAFPNLLHTSPLKESVVRGVDLLVVRELTGGIYFGEPRGEADGRYLNTMVYGEEEIVRIARVALHSSQRRRGKLCSIDKANVLEVSQFWRDVVSRVAREEFADVELTHMYVDNAAMQLMRNPSQFDVLLAPNLFGDILSDEAAMLTGSIGLLASASLGDGSKAGLYEPVHGSAPDIAGRGIANPIAMVLSTALMLRHSFQLPEMALQLEASVEEVLSAGHCTADLGGAVSTEEMGNLIAAEFRKRLHKTR